MGIVVQKFGGSSLANPERIRAVAKIIAKEFLDNKVAVVVSAMQGTTDQLINKVNDISIPLTHAQIAEYDSVISSGEQISSGLLALELMNIGLKARSIQAWQLPIMTDGTEEQNIVEINTKLIKECFEKNIIPVVTGFQGVNNGRITTLGRGGSDTTAVALAHYLEADRCDILTDVDGVYNADPRIVKDAQFIKKINYDEMQAMAECGAKVLNAQATLLAKKLGVNVRIASSFNDVVGTEICDFTTKEIFRGIASLSNSVLVSLKLSGINWQELLEHLALHGLKIHCEFEEHKQIIISANLLIKLQNIIESLANVMAEIHEIAGVSIVSVIGEGIEGNKKLQEFILQSLHEGGIKFILQFAEKCKFSLIVPEEYYELATRFLHKALNFSNKTDGYEKYAK